MAGDALTAPFRFSKSLDFWEATLPVPFWGERLLIQIAAPAAGLSPRQRAVLGVVLGPHADLHGAVADALLAYYNDVWGGVTPSLGQGPELHSPDDVWPFVSQFTVFIPDFRSPAGPTVFEIHLETAWDAEHGLCILFRDGVVADVAGQTDCAGDDY